MSLSVGGYTTGYDYYDMYDYLYDYYYYRDDIPGDEHNDEKEQRNSDQLKYRLEDAVRGNTERDIYDWLEDQHTRRGDIMIELTSPQGTTSTLLPYRKYDFVNEEGYDNWPFMSVHFWGEDPVGTWTLRVNFKSRIGHVSMTDLSVTCYGTLGIPDAVSNVSLSRDSASTDEEGNGGSSATVVIIIASAVSSVVFVAFAVLFISGMLCYCRYRWTRRPEARFSFVPLQEPSDPVTV